MSRGVSGGVFSLLLTFSVCGGDWSQRLSEARKLMAEEAYEDAIRAHQDAVRLAREANEPPILVAELSCELGSAMSEAGHASSAPGEMLQAMAILRKSDVAIARAVCARHLAVHYRASGNYKESADLYLEAIGIEEQLPGRENQLARTIVGLAGLELLRGNNASAGQHARRALSLQQRIDSPSSLEMADSYATLALASRGLGKTLDALVYSERDLALRRAGNAANPNDILLALCLLAAANAELGRSSIAGRWSKQAEDILKERARDPATRKIPVLRTLSYVASQAGDLRKAERLLDEARVLLEADANASRLELAAVWTHLGRIGRRLGAYASAEQCHRTALSIVKDAVPESDPFTAFVWLDLADTYRLMRRYDEAIAHYRKGLRLAENSAGKGSATLALDYRMFANVLRKKNAKAEAKQYLALAKKAKSSSAQDRMPEFTVDFDTLKRKP